MREIIIEDVDVDNNNKERIEGAGILKSNNGMGSISHSVHFFGIFVARRPFLRNATKQREIDIVNNDYKQQQTSAKYRVCS